MSLAYRTVPLPSGAYAIEASAPGARSFMLRRRFADPEHADVIRHWLEAGAELDPEVWHEVCPECESYGSIESDSDTMICADCAGVGYVPHAHQPSPTT